MGNMFKRSVHPVPEDIALQRKDPLANLKEESTIQYDEKGR